MNNDRAKSSKTGTPAQYARGGLSLDTLTYLLALLSLALVFVVNTPGVIAT